MQPAVHAVDLADNARRAVFLADRDGRQLAVRAEGKLKCQRLKIRAFQLLAHLVHDAVDRGAQAAEKILEARAFFVQIRQHTVDVCLDRRAHKFVQRFFGEGMQPAALFRRAQRILHHIVHESSDLGRVKACARALLGAQAIAHEVGKVTRARLIHARGGQRHRIAVERTHRARRQPSARIMRSCSHRLQRALRVALFFKILPQRAADLLTRILKRSRSCRQAIFLVSALCFDADRRQQTRDAPDDERRSLLRALPV